MQNIFYKLNINAIGGVSLKISMSISILCALFIVLLIMPHAALSIDYQEPGWEIKCKNDPFNGKSCYAFGKWGHYTAMGDPLVTLYISYSKSHDNIETLFFISNPRSYPGKPFLLKVDQHKPITGVAKVEDEGIFAREKFPQLFDQLRSGKFILVRYNTWPDGIVDAKINLEGFQDAIKNAQSKLSQMK